MRIRMTRDVAAWALILVTTVLTACGGGGGGDPAPADPGPGGGANPDTSPPVTTLLSAPQTITQETDATFTFEANESPVTFSANLDGAGFQPTTSPISLTGLALGTHTIQIRARDAADNQEDPGVTHQWEIVAPSSDTTPPETTLSSGPSGITNQTAATLEFTSDDPEAVFEGSLDGAAFQAITSPHELSGLADGQHTFRIRALDQAGNIDTTPVEVQWTVDTVAPVTTVNAQPPASTTDISATFNFGSNDASASFEGSLDNAPFTAITSPHTVNNLSTGQHTFRIRAADGAGNVETPPIAITWTITSPGATPTLSVTFPPPVSLTDAGRITVTGKIDNPSGVTQVRVNNQTATSTDNFANWQAAVDLAVGDNALSISAANAGGSTLGNTVEVNVNRVSTLLTEPDRVIWDDANSRGFLADGAHVFRFDAAGALQELTTTNAADGPIVDRPRGLALSADGSLLYVADLNLGAIIEINVVTRARREVSGAGRGAGPILEAPGGLAFGSVGGVPRLYVTDGDKVFAVTISSGDRQIVTDDPFALYMDVAFDGANSRLLSLDLFRPDTVLALDLSAPAPVTPTVFSGTSPTGTQVGSGPVFDQTWRISVNSSQGQALVTDQGLAAVMAVNLANGNRQVFGASQTNATLALIAPRGVTKGPGSNQVLVADFDLQTVVAVDTVSSAISRFLADGVGSGPSVADVTDIAVDPNDGRLYALNGRSFAVIRVDLTTGTRQTVASNSIGNGTQIGQPRQIAVNNGVATVLASPAAGSTSEISLFSANLSNGARDTILANFRSLGTGYEPPEHSDLLVSADRSQAWVAVPYTEEDPDTGGVLALLDSVVNIQIDAKTASVLSGPPGIGSGPTLGLGQSAGIALDDDNNELLIIGDQDGYVMGVSLATAVRRTISENTNVAAGPAIVFPRAILYDTPRRRALVADENTGGLLSLGLTGASLGQRALFSIAETQGPTLMLPSSLASATPDLVLVLDRGRRAVLAVDPTTGDRVIVAR